jgi:regulator of sirC expression with transglutaminase-like and TPR domain
VNRPSFAPTVEARWQAIAAASDDAIDLGEAALVIAAGDEGYRGLDIGAYVSRLDEMGAALGIRLQRDVKPAGILAVLKRYLFEELGFAGNAEDYYDPRNSFFNEVLDRRVGIPITLAVLMIEVGRRAGIALEGVSFPGHFLVKCVVRDGVVVLDPYARGASLGIDDLGKRLAALYGSDPGPQAVRRMLAGAGKREILARMLRNLKAIYLGQRDFSRALSAADRGIALGAASPDDYRDRGKLYLELECFRAALADFQHYLSARPGAADADAVRRKVAELKPLAARLN